MQVFNFNGSPTQNERTSHKWKEEQAKNDQSFTYQNIKYR